MNDETQIKFLELEYLRAQIRIDVLGAKANTARRNYQYSAESWYHELRAEWIDFQADVIESLVHYGIKKYIEPLCIKDRILTRP